MGVAQGWCAPQNSLLIFEQAEYKHQLKCIQQFRQLAVYPGNLVSGDCSTDVIEMIKTSDSSSPSTTNCNLASKIS